MVFPKKYFNKRHFLVFLLLFIFLESSFAQDGRELGVLKKSNIGKVYYFDLSTKKDGLNHVFITYLDIIRSSSGRKFKVLTWKNVWGPNHHTPGIIYIYSDNNEYIGKYNLGSSTDLPTSIKNNHLIFTNKLKGECDSKLISSIEFKDGPPKEIFIKCKGQQGDIYTFSSEQ